MNLIWVIISIFYKEYHDKFEDHLWIAGQKIKLSDEKCIEYKLVFILENWDHCK